MTRRATLQHVAAAAAVSSATVDRVLNGRLPVREATALRVIEAAERIGYHGARLMRERLRERSPMRALGFCLQKRSHPFYMSFGQALSAAASQHRPQSCTAVIDYIDTLAPDQIAERLLTLGREVDAVAVVAVDHPYVTQAIASLQAEGKPSFALLSDVSAPQRAGYIGLDHRKNGRTAAWIIRRLATRSGPIGVFVGSHRYLGQETAEMSFRSYLREHAPDMRVLDARVNLEDTQVAYEAAIELLARERELAGLYIVGGGAAGVIRALREEPGRRIATVCTELTAEHRQALIDGCVDLVIATPLQLIAARAVEVMGQAIDAGGAAAVAAQHTVPFELYISENV